MEEKFVIIDLFLNFLQTKIDIITLGWLYGKEFYGKVYLEFISSVFNTYFESIFNAGIYVKIEKNYSA